MDFHFPHNNIISKNTHRQGDKVRKVETIIAIPSREASIYEKPELIKQIRQGLQEAKEGETETLKNSEKILDES
jgi:hypothetical protein